jgi:2-polyprenyl-3-methyl-5-hydroxy-6-metoxy-1,4-benzoquinol methylase
MAADRHTYEYDIDLNSDVAPARVLRMVRPKSRVLEIGAGPGSVTRHLSGTLECDVTALEIDPSAIEKLRPFARSVFPMDLNDASWSDVVRDREGLFDYVIAADVLEHVYDPWAVLGGMKSLLNDTGSIILSLPHVGHAAVLGNLVDEDFEYRQWGLLDRTHVRFFGVKNVEELYRSQGLAIEKAEFVVRTPEMTEFVHRWNRLPDDVKAALQRNRFAHVYQVVSRAVPVERAGRTVSLLDLPVPPPDAATGAYWTETMASLPVDPERNQRSTTTPEQDLQVAPPGLPRSSRADRDSVRLIAFYLTQFHPIPENDEWWGKGFTEWTNVTKSRPLFKGHYQPHLPTDLGFYDLRVRETRHQQIAMARAYGIDGFCYHYYWFSGKRLLEKPLDDMLADPDSDMPFCLCWANENWNRRWDAQEDELLIAQRYLPDDDLNFIKSLEPFLRDRRYIRVNGAPLIIVYRPQHLPDARKSLAIWRDYCRSVGLGEIHVACALTHSNWDYQQFGYDSGVEFPPHNMVTENLAPHLQFHADYFGYCPDFKDVAEMYLGRPRREGDSVFRGVFPSWDNSARRGAIGTVILNGTPENYEYWLASAIDATIAERPDRGGRLVFINAWNEWAEGCHLEPDRRYGHAFLDATRRAREGTSLAGFPHVGIPAEAAPEADDGREVYAGVYKTSQKPKSALSRSFKAVRDTLNGRRFRKEAPKRA